MAPPRGTGLEIMRGLTRGFPEQLALGFELGVANAPGRGRKRPDLWISGMGGSGIGGHLLSHVLRAETGLLPLVTDGLHLPAGFGENSLVILVSYSGSTWETLDAYGTASRKGARRIVLSSGGELSKCATRDGVPLIPLPPGLPPRAAVGYIIGGLLGVCDKWFARSNEDRVRKISRRLRYRQSRWAERKGLPASLAKLVGSRLPTIYADAKIGSVARRWKTQVEENAKRLALFDVFPEVLHNAIVGWDALDASRARRHALLSIAWEGQSPRVRAGMEYLHRLVRRKGVRCALVPLDSTDLLEALLFGVSIGDHFSLFLAEAAGVNPFPYRAITRMKDALRIDPAFAP